jgi:hypothetical protein
MGNVKEEEEKGNTTIYRIQINNNNKDQWIVRHSTDP